MALIDRFLPQPDAVEKHSATIAAAPDVVYAALRRTDFAASWVVKGLLALRALPGIVLGRGLGDKARRRLDLDAIVDAGFGLLAEEPGRELVLGVVGRFWRPVSNLDPFRHEAFSGTVPRGLSIAAWNFTVRPADGGTLLGTETRIACGDRASRLKFRAYWLLVRPFSGWIRRRMLVAIRREALSDADG